MMNGAQGPAAEQPDNQMPSVSTSSSPGPAAPASPTPVTRAYRSHTDRGFPQLQRGIVWSDLVREMEEEHVARLAGATEMVTPLRPDHIESGDRAEGIEDAA